MNLVKSEDHFPFYVIGGGCFRKNAANKYVLDWIWIHPFARNRGKLKSLWPKFKEKFGDFSLQEPLSAHMEMFMQKHGQARSSAVAQPAGQAQCDPD
jgi:hypothetical protein